MSSYDMPYIRENFRVGFRDTLGPAWHDVTGEFTYPAGIPMEDAREFLGWVPQKRALMVEGDNGEAVPLRKSWGRTPVAVTRPDTGALVGLMDENYPTTSYSERLLDGLSAILDDSDLSIGSILVLDGGSKASVQITMDDTTEIAGDSFRLWLAAYTSLDGSLKTTFKKGCTRVVCDNTLDLFTREGGAKYSYKNTANSGLQVATAREALQIFTDMGSELSLTVEQMVDAAFSDGQWSQLLDALPTTSLTHLDGPKKGQEKDGRGKTRTENTRMDITGIYHNDARVSEYTGTQWGSFQAFSTYNQHESTVQKDDNELQRNARKMLSGQTFDYDSMVMSAIGKVAAMA
jgi:phage/plasmid-like protein (TIGR03299 family)